MDDHRSFRASDFRLSDFPYSIAGLGICSALLIGIGLSLETVPSLWKVVLLVIVVGILIPVMFLKTSKKIDVSKLPEPSASVQQMCHDNSYSLAELVKLYSDESGLGIAECKAVVEKYISGNLNK